MLLDRHSVACLHVYIRSMTLYLVCFILKSKNQIIDLVMCQHSAGIINRSPFMSMELLSVKSTLTSHAKTG